MSEKKTSQEWLELGLHYKGGCREILDPDGWDRRNWDFSWYEEKITEKEFLNRLTMCTGAWLWDKLSDKNIVDCLKREVTDTTKPEAVMVLVQTLLKRREESTAKAK